MYHSVTIGSMNTYTDWHLVPDGRPVIAMPEVRKNYVEVPGMSGSLDLSESLTGYPLYEKREGELKFHVLNGYNWIDIYSKIAAYLHGKKHKMVLEDDPNWYYEGRFHIVEWISNNDGTWSDITIGYNLDPYKKFHLDSTEIKPAYFSELIVPNNTTTHVDIYAPADNSVASNALTTNYEDIVEPIDPIIIVKSYPITVRYKVSQSVNGMSSLRIDTESVDASIGTHTFSELGLPAITGYLSTDMDGYIEYKSTGNGSAKVTTKIRFGAL